MEGKTIAGIDIGSSKITSVIAQLTDEEIVIRGISSAPTKSISKGILRDLNLCAQEIDASFSSAVYSSGVHIDKVHLSLTSKQIKLLKQVGDKILDSEPRAITDQDVEELLASIPDSGLSEGEVRIQRIPEEFILNDAEGVRNPVGMVASKLSVKAQDVICPSWLLSNYERALERVGLGVLSVIPSIFCAASAVLTEEEAETGCILLDLGHGTTDIGIFRDGHATYMSTLPVGGSNFDTDIMQGLGVGYDEAQRIKKSFVKAWIKPEPQEGDEFIDIRLYGQKEYSKVKKQKLIEVVLPRLEEWAQLIKREIEQSGLSASIPGGVVLVGGGSYMRDITTFFSHHLKRAVRIGLPIGFSHLFEEFRAPQYASALGIASFAKGLEREVKAVPLSFLEELYSFFSELWYSMPWVKKKGEDSLKKL